MGDIIEIDVTGTNRVVYLVVGAYDDNGEMQYALYGEYTAPDGDSEEWQPIGRAKLTEGFLSCLSLSPFTSETFEVEVEETSTSTTTTASRTPTTAGHRAHPIR